MPALVILGHRFPLIAEEDVRNTSKYALLGRAVQTCLLLPSIILLMRQRTRPCGQQLQPTSSWIITTTTSGTSSTNHMILLRTFAFLSMVTIFISCLLDTVIFRVASRGTPVQTEKRQSLRWLCAIKLFPFTILRAITMVLAICSVLIVQNVCNDCRCLRGTVPLVLALAWTHIIDVLIPSLVIFIFVCRRAHAQAMYYMQLLACGSTKKSTNKGSWWKCFCQCCCACTSISTCCLFGGMDIIADTAAATPSSLSDVSVALADYFNTSSSDDDDDHQPLDFTLSDIHVGLYALAAEQRTLRRQRWKSLQQQDMGYHKNHNKKAKKGQEEKDTSIICRSVVGTSVAVGTFNSFDILDVEIGSEHPDDEDATPQVVGDSRAFVLDFQLRRDDNVPNALTYFEPTKRIKLEKTNDVDNHLIQEGAHYMRYALAVYGHLMYSYHMPCTAPCRLACNFVKNVGHCCCCCNRNTKEDEIKHVVVGDNCLGCNKAAFLLISQVDEHDIAYMSFKNAINVLPYVILVDRSKKAVVLVIRGTFSLEGLVTDLRIRPELLDNYQDKYPGLGGSSDTEGEFCHSGFLHSALAIFEDLERHQILNRLLLGDSPQFPGFSLVLTGHSLGAGCAAVLSLILREKFYGVQCFCFSPPGCVFSDKASFQNHIVSYVLDSDIVPCLSLHSMNGLRDDILLMIARLKVPKHEVWKKVAKGDNEAEYESWTSAIAYSRENIPDSEFYRQLVDFLQRQEETLKDNQQFASVQLRPPGKIVHLIASHNQGSSFFERGARQKTYVPVYAERNDFCEIQITRSFLYYHDPLLVLTQLQRIADDFK